MICTEYDSYIQELEDYGNPIWVATLDTGTVVYQDDRRFGPNDPAWLRLKEHCEKTGEYIENFAIKFRSNRVNIENRNALGWFFRRSALGGFGMPTTAEFYLVGQVLHDGLRVEKYKVPELLFDSAEVRNIEEYTNHIIYGKTKN